MSEHTQLYLPSHLSGARGGERGTFFAVFAQLKANATRAGTLIPYKERERSWGNKGGGTLRGNGARRSSLPSYPLSPALNSGAASAPHPSPALGDHSASQWHCFVGGKCSERAKGKNGRHSSVPPSRGVSEMKFLMVYKKIIQSYIERCSVPKGYYMYFICFIATAASFKIL